MNKFLSIVFFITITMSFQAQTFCLQLEEVSNDGTNLVLTLDAQGSEAFNLGSANLQFLTSDGAFGAPTIVSSVLAPPTYFVPTLTQPSLGSYSLNIELIFPGISIEIAAAPAFSNLVVISLPILDAALADEGIAWQYNGGTTETVIFLDDEATQILATSPDCLQGIDAVLPPVGADQCAGALAIGEGIFTNAGPSIGAGASNACFGAATNATWYAYTASGDGIATVSSSIDLDEPDTRVSIHASCEDLNCITSDDDSGAGFTTIATFDATIGTTYLVEWDDRWDDGEFDFEISLDIIVVGEGCIDPLACNFDATATVDDGSCILAVGCDICDGIGGLIDNPEIGDICDDGDAETENDVLIACDLCEGTLIVVAPNALCVDAIAIGEGIVLAADISGGAGATSACFAGGINALYYAYTASGDGVATVSSSIDLDQPDTRVSIHASCEDLNCIAADDDGGAGFTTIATFDATAGATYIVEWDDRWDAGEFDFEISLEPVIEPISGCMTLEACNYNVLANEDDGSCLFALGCDECDGLGGVTDNPEIGDVCDDGLDETINDIFINCDICLGFIPECFDPAACNYSGPTAIDHPLTDKGDDSFCIYANGCDECDGFSGVTDNPEIGDACNDGDATTTNDVLTACDVCMGTPLASAPNALCADAIAIGEGIVLAADINGGAGATNSCFINGGANALFYEYTASADGEATITSSIDLDLPDTRLSVFIGSCDDLTCLTSNDDLNGDFGFTSGVTFTATAGTVYLVEWDDRWDDGEFDFEISLEPSVEPIFGCTDENACNFNPEATINDESCDLGLWYIPSGVAAGPAILACDVPDGYSLADQECIISIINGDPFCVEINFDQLCLDAYLECTGVVFECEEIASNIWGTGLFVTGGAHYTFVASNANDAILAQGAGDVSIEVFLGECGGESLGIFDNYGEGEIERAVPGGLIAGNTYSYFVTGENSEAIISKVKTYATTTIEDNHCGSTMELIDQIYCSREDDMYSNPVVNVTGFGFRFINQANGDEILLQDGTMDGFYQQLTTIGGFELGATYDVSARHQVIQSANGSVMSLWSDYGPACPVIIESQVPLTNVRDEYCGGESSFSLGGMIKAYPVVGADMYEWAFNNGVDVITHQTVGYPVYLYQISGLQYGQAYNVSVRGHLNGNWGEFGSTCTILMDSQPESTKVRDTHCGLDYAYPSVELLYADFVGAATEYTWEFSNGIDVLEFTTSNYKLLMYQPGLATGIYDVRVKAFAGGVYGDYAASCSITLNGGGDMANNQDSQLFDKSISWITPEATVYPNPNTGEMVCLNVANLNIMDGDVEVRVIDMFGKLIMNEQITLNGNSFNHELKLNQDLSVGMYMIQIQIETQLLVEKLIVE